MTLDTARQIGRKQAIAAQLVAMIILELIWFFGEAGSDLANGLIFFIDAQINIDMLLFFVFLFGATWFWGSKAGMAIFADPRRYQVTGIKYSLRVSGVMVLYVSVIYVMHNGFDPLFYQALAGAALVITLCVVIAWLWASRQMMLKMKN